MVAGSLREIAVRNKFAIQALIRLLETTQEDLTCQNVTFSLGEIIKTKKQYQDVVFSLSHNLTDEVHKKNFDLFEKCFKLLWKCAENLTYPQFYRHYNTITPHPEMIDYTPIGHTPTVRPLEQLLIDAKKLQNLNSESKFVQGFCIRLYPKLLPHETIPKVQTVTDLETEIINLKQQLKPPICSFYYEETQHRPPK